MKRTLLLLPCLALALTTSGHAQDGAVPLQPPGVSKGTRTAIDKGLKFLAREQNKDGSWRTGGGYGSYPVAMTGLAGLALMAGGSTPVRGPYAKNVRRAVNFCLANRQPNGLITAPSEESRSMYGHGFSMLFLAQAYGTEEDKERQRKIRVCLEAGIKLIARSQSRDVGEYGGGKGRRRFDYLARSGQATAEMVRRCA